MDLGLRGRVALVTGSSRGIGRSAARLFGSEGARVAITYRTDRDRAEAVVAEIGAGGGEAMAVFLDLADSGSIHAATRAVVDRWGRLDILVNNAVQWGTASRTPSRKSSARPASSSTSSCPA